LLGKHAHHVGIVVFKSFLHIAQNAVKNFERITKLLGLSKLHPLWMVDDIISLLGRPFDSVDF